MTNGDFIKVLSKNQEFLSNLIGDNLSDINHIAIKISHHNKNFSQHSCNILARKLKSCLICVNIDNNLLKNTFKGIPRIAVKNYLKTHHNCSQQVRDMLNIHCQRMDNADTVFAILPTKIALMATFLKYHSDSDNKSGVLGSMGYTLSKTINRVRKLLDVKSSDGMPKNAVIVIK